MTMLDYTASYTDQYQLAMAQVYFLQGRHNDRATFDYFFRKAPFAGGYSVFAGLEDLLDILTGLRFNEADITFLRQQGMNEEFLSYLMEFRFRGHIYAPPEGEIVFPTEPVLTVEANIIEAQIIETLLLNILNFQTLIATKASRMRLVAPQHVLVDFGLRRAQSTGGYHASRAAVVGGFDATSNVIAARDFGITVSGTMAHSFVQSYDSELQAFRTFAACHPDNCVLLVDTYSTLASGIPNAITVAQEMQSQGQRLKAVRLDSGDLAYLAKKARKMLDDAGLSYVKIAVSNQLDEHVIKSLLDQDSPIDIFGVGTNLVIGRPDAALDGVYKLAFSRDKPRIKLSENKAKTTLPYSKQVYRLTEDSGDFYGADLVVITGEENINVMYHPFEPFKSLTISNYTKEPLRQRVFANGQRVMARKSLKQIAQYAKRQLNRLPPEFKRFDNPHIYKIGLSKQLKEKRDHLIAEHKSKRWQ